VSLLFCTTCGADLSQPAKVRRERILFVLTPFFLILMGITLGVEFKLADAVDNGMAYGGALAMLYLFSAMVFWATTKAFKLPSLPESFWQAGLISTVNFVLCSLLAFLISEVFSEKVIMAVGPARYHYAVLETLVVVFLPVFFSGLLAVSARARVTRFPESAPKPFLGFLFKHALVLIPFAVAFLTAFISFAQPAALRATVQARVLYELQAADVALDIVDAALAADESYAQLHFMKGILILDFVSTKYRATDSVKSFERANELKPAVPTWLYFLSMAYDRERDGPAAIAAATQAVDLLPQDSSLWQHLGDLNMKYNNGAAAVTAYKKAFELTPDDPKLLNNLAYAMLELNMELPQALEMARMSVELLPGYSFNLDTLAWAYYKNSQYAEALEVMSDIFAGRNEVSPEIDFHYAVILQAMGMLKSPLETFDKLLARPEVAADHKFFQQVYQARLAAEKSASGTVSPEELNKDETTADKTPEQPEQAGQNPAAATLDAESAVDLIEGD
jgi:tetratricopeptide (TPR) repeat protein